MKNQNSLPPTAMIEVTDIDIDGDVFAKIVNWQGHHPRIEIAPDGKGHAVLAIGDRALARLKKLDDGTYEASVIKRAEADANRVMGVVKILKNGAVLEPASRRAKHEYALEQKNLNGAKHGDIAVAEILPGGGLRNKGAKIVKVIGRANDPKSFSLLSIYETGLRPEFPAEVIASTQGMKVPPAQNREDLTNIPLITIDGADAKDFDDAVFAEKTPEGFHLIVAIADVSYYVRAGTALDDEARRRGNSTYFPDRVVPMLPEILSNDLCSLRPHDPRATLAVHMWIDKDGALKKYEFVRGLMKSHARMTYEQVQELQDRNAAPAHIAPLYEAYAVLDAARRKRGALELDLTERRVILDDAGNVKAIVPRARLDSHKLIEEFMVLANVAAALALEAKKAPCAYRIHDRPSPDKLDAARQFVESLGFSLPKGQTITPFMLNQILSKASQTPHSHLVSQVILRCQSQANYSPNNIGHFGLALPKYAHFTSPIRRYSDLLVHRSLIAAYNLGEGGLEASDAARFEETCDHISATERTSIEAERGSMDRFMAAFLSTQVGGLFSGRIGGVTRFGLFVDLDESGASGLVPIRRLPDDYYIHDERAHALIGRKSGRVFRLGARVNVKIREAEGITGSTVFDLVGHERGADIPGAELRPRSRRDDRRGENGRDNGPGAKRGRNRRDFKKRPRR